VLIDAKCPECREKVPVTESASDQKIECHGCGKKFVVPGLNPSPKEEPTKARAKDRERDEPKRKAASRRSRRDDDDDDDDRPRRRKDEESGSGMMGLLVFGGVGLTLLAVGFGITAWLIFSGDGKKEKESADNTSRPVENRPEFPQERPTPPPNNNNLPGFPDNVPGPQDNDPPIKRKNPKPMVDVPPVEEPPPRKPPRVVPPPRVEPPKVEEGPPAAPASPVVQLPGAATEQAVVGAGGKFLFLHLKKDRQVAVFDPAQKKIVKYVPITEDDAVLAAGLEHLIIGYPGSGKIDRVRLDTYEVDNSMEVPSKFPLRALGLGAFVKNPLLAACGNFPHGDDFFLIDVVTMKRYDNSAVKNPGQTAEINTHIHVSQDGRTFGVEGSRFGGAQVFQMRTTGWIVNPVKFPLGGITADGETVLGPGQLASLAGQPIGEKKNGGKGVWYFPSTQGPYFGSLNERTYGKWPQERKFAELQLHVGRSQETLVSFPELPELAEFVDFFFQKTKPLDRHIFFFPQNDLVAILPAARDRIHLRTVDVKAELEKSKINFLAVTSRPPSVKFGETFRYKPDILCKKGPATLRLDAAPVGMKLDGDTLTWAVPTRANQPPANVILTVADAAGQEMFHSFEITVFEK
jgi:hypothetical protein